MYQPIILCIALRYVYSKTTNQFSQFIYWIASISIISSLMLIIIILSIMNGFERELKNNILYFIPHAIVTAVTGSVHTNQIPDFLLSNTVSHKIKYIKPIITSNVILQSTHKASLGIMFGVNPLHFEPLFSCLMCNRMNQLKSGKYYIIIGSKLAQQLSVNIHDQIRLTVPSLHQITPIGNFPSQRLFTILDIYVTNSEVDTYQVLIHQDDAAKLMHYPPQYITGWRIWIEELFKINRYNNQFNNDNQQWKWQDWSEYKGSLFQAVKMEKNIMCILFILIILVSGFNIVSFLTLLVTDKQKEIAILRAQGLKRLHIVTIFMVQSLFNGIFSVICGSGLGILFSKKINQVLLLLGFFPKTLQFPVEIQYLQILSIDLIICILMVLFAFYPAWYISTMQPAQILRYD